MNNLNPLLLLDFYKTTHSEQYPKNLSKIVSYFTPRMSRLENENHLIMFGLQGFIKTYLINSFNDNFFNKPKIEILTEYKRIIDNTLGKNIVDYKKIEQLHDLGYLPIEIKAMEEGTRVPIKVPMFEISNTHKDFAWLVNTLETALSCSLWQPMISANVGYMYRKIVNKYFDTSVDNSVNRARALGDFSMRGQESCESAIKSSAAFCLSFLNTATVPAVLYLEDNYNCDSSKDEVAFGAISTEHSVMNSNFAVDGDEISFIKRLLVDIYPNNSFSMVSDSYDYWNLIDNLLPLCKAEIMNHKGYIGIRGDSGDPVEITTKTVFRLFELFGGEINSKGFKVLDSHIKVIYGDSITPQRAEKIYAKLIKEGFACNNVLLGVGSFSMQSLEQNEQLQPYTRDTFGIAIKATYGEIDGHPIMIFKNPKTDSGNFKKSQKGCCAVFLEDGIIKYKDNLSFDDACDYKNNLLVTTFKDGKMVKEQSLKDIRKKLHGGSF